MALNTKVCLMFQQSNVIWINVFKFEVYTFFDKYQYYVPNWNIRQVYKDVYYYRNNVTSYSYVYYYYLIEHSIDDLYTDMVLELFM